MKFTYKWKISGQEFIGSFNCENETSLKHHIESVGGQLIEIITLGIKTVNLPIEDITDVSYDD